MSDARQIEFKLRDGFLDSRTGVTHREGALRIPTQKDRTVVLKVAGEIDNRAYRETILFSQILVRLGEYPLDSSNRQDVVEQMSTRDIDYLSTLLYQWHNEGFDENELCPTCGHRFAAMETEADSHDEKAAPNSSEG